MFFRDAGGLSTRLVSANYWAGYGARAIRLWLRLFAEDGAVLATWEQEVPPGLAGFSIDSRAVRERFDLPEFTGQLCVHAIGATGHDVVKYALDTYASDNGASRCRARTTPTRGRPIAMPDCRRRATTNASCCGCRTATPCRSRRGAIALDRMGAEHPVALDRAVGPFATVALDVADLLPDVRWPAQIELRAGRHVVRPRYEVTRAARTRIAHVNVERADLRPDPAIADAAARAGPRLSAAVPGAAARAFPQHRAADADGREPGQPAAAARRVRSGGAQGCATLPRLPAARPRGGRGFRRLSPIDSGHAELVYDFRDGGAADGWLHALFRYEDRQSGHVAESSFGAHMFNTVMTWRDEPQSYSGPPPGLSTTLFLRLGDARRRSFAVLIYPGLGTVARRRPPRC